MKIDKELLCKFFDYNPDTGALTNKLPRGTRCSIGGKAGALTLCGAKGSERHYLRITFFGSRMYVHRIIWIIVTGEEPECIDHMDGNSLNNKWENLRSVSHRINGKNQKIHTTNTSGTSGVTYRKDSGRWRARIMVDDNMISLGTFKEKNDAIEARKKAEGKYGYDLLAKR